jgi:hypothetical protein
MSDRALHNTDVKVIRNMNSRFAISSKNAGFQNILPVVSSSLFGSGELGSGSCFFVGFLAIDIFVLLLLF